MVNNIFVDRLKQSRINSGLTQVKVSEITGINNKTLSGYEHGVSEPDIKTLNILANCYDVSIDYLTGISQTPKSKIEDKDILRLERAKNKMSKESWERAMKILKAGFEEYFQEDDSDET